MSIALCVGTIQYTSCTDKLFLSVKSGIDYHIILVHLYIMLFCIILSADNQRNLLSGININHQLFSENTPSNYRIVCRLVQLFVVIVIDVLGGFLVVKPYPSIIQCNVQLLLCAVTASPTGVDNSVDEMDGSVDAVMEISSPESCDLSYQRASQSLSLKNATKVRTYTIPTDQSSDSIGGKFRTSLVGPLSHTWAI